VTQERALADLNGIAARLAREYPNTNGGWSARIQTLRQAFLPDDVHLVIGLMMASVTIVLFIACSNVANLLLARASARRRELAVRIAIGAGRGRIVRQLLTEAVVLALASVPLGLVLAALGTRLIAAQVPPDNLPYYIQWSLDARSLAYTIAIAVGTALVFGLVPAIQTTSPALQENLKEGARGSTGSRALVRNALVVSQVSLSVVALVGAMLFVRSYRNLDSQELGFDTRPLMTMRFVMGDESYSSRNARLRRVQEVVRGVESLPGVEAVFASNLVPIDGGGSGGEIEVDGRKSGTGGGPSVSFLAVTPGFHRTLGVRIRRGRDLGDSEAWSTSPVAVINESMARRVWPNEDPIGRRFRFRNEDDGAREWLTVVGVAPNLQLFGVNPESSETPPSAFAPYGYSQTVSTGLTIRVAGDPASITSAARAVIRAADPGMPITAVRTMEDLRNLAYWEYLIYGWIFGVVGVTGVLLASIGVYGVLAYSVSQRTQEIGVRVALGAAREHVLKLIVGQGLGLAVAGVVVGLVLAALSTPLARSLLFNVSPFDPVSFIAVSMFLIGVALAASYVPALRATRVDPMVALRQE
jgi:putative ABC transport system permease protein